MTNFLYLHLKQWFAEDGWGFTTYSCRNCAIIRRDFVTKIAANVNAYHLLHCDILLFFRSHCPLCPSNEVKACQEDEADISSQDISKPTYPSNSWHENICIFKYFFKYPYKYNHKIGLCKKIKNKSLASSLIQPKFLFQCESTLGAFSQCFRETYTLRDTRLAGSNLAEFNGYFKTKKPRSQYLC